MTVHSRLRFASLLAAAAGLVSVVSSGALNAQSAPAPVPGAVTFSKDIAPIFQAKCQNCHRPGSVAPMSLITYQEVRPWARAIKMRTLLGTKRGAMPPWGIEKDIGIQHYKNDLSLSEEQIATIAKWVDSGAPEGNPADMPPPRNFSDLEWVAGTPDLIVRGPEITVPAVAPDSWGSLGTVPVGNTEDRYVMSVEVREVNDVPQRSETGTVIGGRKVFHHLQYETFVPGEDPSQSTSWPTHEVGRNADHFSSDAGRLLKANSVLNLNSAHLHTNGRETKARLEFGYRFFPKGYKPRYREGRIGLSNSVDIDLKPNKPNQEVHSYSVLQQNTKIITFEPHLHATGVRMCLEAIWGPNIIQLTCSSYDHNWVRVYAYEEGYEPLLPKGTIMHAIAFLDTSTANKGIADTRNWSGGGRRSVSSMFFEMGFSVALSDDEFLAEMAERRKKMKGKNDWDLGCPLCNSPQVTQLLQAPGQITAGN